MFAWLVKEFTHGDFILRAQGGTVWNTTTAGTLVLGGQRRGRSVVGE